MQEWGEGWKRGIGVRQLKQKTVSECNMQTGPKKKKKKEKKNTLERCNWTLFLQPWYGTE